MKDNQTIKPFSVVIPVYNEAQSIKSVLENLKNFLNSKEYEWEIVCVDDKSSDDSGKILDSIDDIKVIHHRKNRGYGGALKTGIKNAKYDIIVIMDSDGQHSPKDIPKLLNYLGKDFDMVVGSRSITNTNKSRILGKVVLHKLATYLIRDEIPDINSGFRAFYKKEAEKYLHLCSERFSFTTSITLAYLQDNKFIKYIPIEVKLRETGESQVDYKSGLRTMLKIIQMVMIFNPLRVILPIVFFFAVLFGISFINDLIHTNLTDSTVFLGTTTILVFMFALLSDQISTIRKELWLR